MSRRVDDLEAAVDYFARHTSELTDSEKSLILRRLKGEKVVLSKRCEEIINEFRKWITES